MTATAARGRTPADRMLRTAARGAALIGVAVVIGILLLQVVDKGTNPTGTGTTPTVPHADGTTTSSGNVRPPQEVRVLVLNGSGVAQAAATQANTLRGLGYAIAGTGNAPTQQGSTVECKTGFDDEAAALAKTVNTTTIAAFPATPPAGAENADCIVIVGK